LLRTVVIYRSISGYTKKYAQWIAKECNADIYDAKEFNTQKLSDYSTIIFGGSLHAVGINGIACIKENLPKLTNKKIVIFTVGASPPKEGIIREIMDNNFSTNEQGNLKLFYLRGGFDFNKLDFPNKIIMALFRVRLTLKKNKSSDEMGMLTAYSKPMDLVRKENIKQLVDYVKSAD
jgi:menaquinone-dependent protoporphyrinogen IX oxidase